MEWAVNGEENMTRQAASANALVVAFAPLFLAGCESAPAGDESATARNHAADPCPREPAVLIEVKGVVRDVTNEPPCGLVFRSTGVRLTAIADGSHPDPGPHVVKDGRGRYYSTQADGWDHTISVWSEDGTYLTSFGSHGEGPGEFEGAWLSLFLDDADSLHVNDSDDWIIFSPEHEFVRQITAPSTGSGFVLQESYATNLLYDGRILTSNSLGSGDDGYFRTINRDGSLDRSFGKVEDGTGAGGDYGVERAIAYRAGWASFWAAPSVRGSNDYVLEEWDIVGGEGIPEADRKPTIVQSLRRRQPWFRWTGDQYTSPMVVNLHITEDDILYVMLWRPSEEYLEAMKDFEGRKTEGGWNLEVQEEVDALATSLTHFVIEAIDVRAARLLASAISPVGDFVSGSVLFPHGWFRNQATGYTYGIGEDGLPYVEIIEAVLEGK